MRLTKTQKQKTPRNYPVCDVCRQPGYKLTKAWDGRPSFVCDCGNSWTCGQTGDEYMGAHWICNKDYHIESEFEHHTETIAEMIVRLDAKRTK